MRKQFTLLFFLLFSFTTILFAQELVFSQNGKELNEGSTVYCSELDAMGNMDPHIFIKNKGAKISASLNVSLLAEPEGGSIGFCGWGSEECTPVEYENEVIRSTTIEANQEIDPRIEAMNVDPNNTLIKVQYKLTYSGKEKVLNVIFTTNPTSITSPSEDLDITLYRNNGNVYMDYNFPTIKNREIILYNIVGKKVAQYSLTDDKNTIIFLNLHKGIYMYSIIENNTSVKCGKYIF